jgi:phage terminase small subunit
MGQAMATTGMDEQQALEMTAVEQSSAQTAYDRLPYRRKLFVDAYIRLNGNGTRAAIEAGYSAKCAYAEASRLLRIAEVAEAIADYWRERAMSPEEVIGRLSEQAKNEAAAYIRHNDEGEAYLDTERMIADGKQHLIAGLKRDARGNLMIELFDAQEALVHVGRSMQLFGDSNRMNAVVGVKRLIGVSEDEF